MIKNNKLLLIKTTASIVALGFLLTTNVLAMDTFEDSSEEVVPGSSLTPKQELKKKAKSGDVQSQYDLGMLYSKGVGDVIIVKKPQKAILWLEKAAANDHTESQIEVTRMYLNLAQDDIPHYLLNENKASEKFKTVQ